MIFSMTLNDPHFKGAPLLDVEYLINDIKETWLLQTTNRKWCENSAVANDLQCRGLYRSFQDYERFDWYQRKKSYVEYEVDYNSRTS